MASITSGVGYPPRLCLQRVHWNWFWQDCIGFWQPRFEGWDDRDSNAVARIHDLSGAGQHGSLVTVGYGVGSNQSAIVSEPRLPGCPQVLKNDRTTTFGNGNRVELPDAHPIDLNGCDAITMLMVIYFESSANNDPRVITRQSSGAESGHHWMLGIRDSSGANEARSRIKISGTTRTNITNISSDLDTGDWWLIGCTWKSGDRVRFFHRNLFGGDAGEWDVDTPMTSSTGTHTGTITDDTAVAAYLMNRDSGSPLDGSLLYAGIWCRWFPESHRLKVIREPYGMIQARGMTLLEMAPLFLGTNQNLLASLISGGSVGDPSLQGQVAAGLLDGGAIQAPVLEGAVAADLLDGGGLVLPSLQGAVAAGLIDGGAVLEPVLDLGEAQTVDAPLLDGGAVHSPGLEGAVAAPLLDGGSVETPSLQGAAEANLVDGGAVQDPTLQGEVSPPALDGGAVHDPAMEPQVAPGLLDGGSTHEPEASIPGTVSPPLVDGGGVSEPGLSGEVAAQFLDGGVVRIPELLAQIAPQLLDGGVVRLPELAVTSIDAPLLDGGLVLSPAITSEVFPGLVDGGSITAPTLRGSVGPALIDGGAVYLPDPLQDQLLVAGLLDGGSVLLPDISAVLAYVDGTFEKWTIPPSNRRFVVPSSDRKFEIPPGGGSFNIPSDGG